MKQDRLWYAAYGSNLLHARFSLYLTGGSYAKGHRRHIGARDNQKPKSEAPLINGPWRLCFGHSSSRWGGGVAFLDPENDQGASVRCWNITHQQFADVAAQENGLLPGELEINVDEVMANGDVEIGNSWYSRIVYLGDHQGLPLLTFTSSQPPEPTTPGEPYLSVILNGFLEAEPTKLDQHVDRLLRADGVAPIWTREALLGLANRSTRDQRSHES
ncbi:MAG TPA: hypothetical protein QF409_09780 [Acidimicrobiales bacterium]|nr:hypothetical protein [Acidimicrobiales bacterium]